MEMVVSLHKNELGVECPNREFAWRMNVSSLSLHSEPRVCMNFKFTRGEPRV